jgi:hypothetical protein
LNNYRVPLAGETVLIYIATDGTTVGPVTSGRVYYGDVISAHSSIHSNKFPNYAGVYGDANMLSTGLGALNNYGNIASELKRNILPLQPYDGDTMLQDRYGSAIRFSRTVPQPAGYTKKPFWKGLTPSDPIVTITCGLKSEPKTNYYCIEKPDDTDSSIILSSTQQINSTTLSQRNLGDKVTPLSRYSKPQILLTADRLVFNSKKDEIVLSAKKTVSMATPNWAMNMNEFFNLIEDLMTELVALTSGKATIATGVGPTGKSTNERKIKEIFDKLKKMKQ